MIFSHLVDYDSDLKLISFGLKNAGHVFEGCEIVDYINTAEIYEEKDLISGLLFFIDSCKLQYS